MAIKKWVCDEPRRDLGSRRTQSRPGFATNPEQTWVRVEPRTKQTWVLVKPRAEQSKLGFATNPDLLWVPVEPRAEQTWVRD
ncbi:hypothetical protein SLEP1_g38648 [Rubroshorea leprosula]|uniref:Uncharacterized protein n=1 Tax=Rubroshorea leprosula TaxID=152421 RepID=A0AAV5KY02_9ROSI|nr:hypothetical protein SLEP1_g38648 [Rubroshorea leprosula]